MHSCTAWRTALKLSDRARGHGCSCQLLQQAPVPSACPRCGRWMAVVPAVPGVPGSGPFAAGAAAALAATSGLWFGLAPKEAQVLAVRPEPAPLGPEGLLAELCPTPQAETGRWAPEELLAAAVVGSTLVVVLCALSCALGFLIGSRRRGIPASGKASSEALGPRGRVRLQGYAA